MILTVTANPSIDKTYLVDSLSPGHVLRVKECVATIGGKGLNVSKAARRLGAEVTATGFVGGHSGAYICEGLADYGIADAFIRTAAETRTCINVVEQKTNVSTEFLEPGKEVGEESEHAFFARFGALAEKADVITVSGSLPKGLSADFYLRLTDEAKRAGKRLILDTSGALLAAAVEGGPYMIKPNAEELSQLAGRPLSDEEEIIRFAGSLLEKGIAAVCVTLGKSGSITVTENAVYRTYAPSVDAVSAVGSGDSFVAGMAYGFSQELDMEQCLRIATATAAANAMQYETGCFRQCDVEASMGKVVTKIVKGGFRK